MFLLSTQVESGIEILVHEGGDDVFDFLGIVELLLRVF